MMKTKHWDVMRSALVAVALVWFGSVAANDTAPRVINIEAPGNLESTHDTGCIAFSETKNRYTPADLYRAMMRCIERERYEDGAMLFAQAGVYGRFDSLRVADRTAHQAMAVLLMSTFGTVQEPKKSAFQAVVQKTFGNPENLARACAAIRKLGPPDYHPRYMIQHGMGAFTGGAGDGLTAGFDAADGWKRALDTYLHCPGL